MANIKFMEPGSAATGDLSLFSTVTSAVSSTSTPHTGSRCINLAQNSRMAQAGVLADAGRRISFYFRSVAQYPSAVKRLVSAPAGGAEWIVRLGTDGLLTILTGTTVLKTGVVATPIDQWFRISVAYVITSTTNFTIKVWLNGTLNVTATNVDGTLGATGASQIEFGGEGISAGQGLISDIYIDDGTTLDDPGGGEGGDILVTTKRPNALGTANNFATNIGAYTNRWELVDDLPVNTNGWYQGLSASEVAENYGIQSISQGDADMTGKTLLGRMAWARGLRDQYGPSQKSMGGFSTKQTTTPAGAVTVAVGDLVIAVFEDQIGGNEPTIADNFGNSWTRINGGTNTARVTYWYSIIATGKAGSMTVTWTHAQSQAKRAWVVAVFPAALIAATPLDKNIAPVTNDSTSPYDAPSSGTLAQANELVFSVFSFAGPDTDTYGYDTGETLGENTAMVGGTNGGSATANTTLFLTVRRVAATDAVVMQMSNATANRAAVKATFSFKCALNPTNVAKITDNGSDSAAIALNYLVATYALAPVTSGTYPSGAAIGMKALGGCGTTLHDCGVILAYQVVPAAGYTLTADVGAVTVQGKAAGLYRATVIDASGAKAVTVAGQVAGLFKGYPMIASVGAVTVEGKAAGLYKGSSLGAGVGAVAVEGKASGLYKGSVVKADVGAVSVVGLAANLLFGRILTASAGAITVEGKAANTLKNSVLVSAVGTITVEGKAAGIFKGFTLDASGAHAIAVVGNSAALLYGRSLSALVGAITVEGKAANTLKNSVLAAAPGAITVVGQVADALFARWLDATGAHAIIVTGRAADLTYTQIGHYTLVADAGAITVAGLAASLFRHAWLTGDVGSVAVVGQSAGLFKGYTLVAGSKAITVAGVAADLLKSSVLSASNGSISVSGAAAELLKGSWLVASNGAITVEGKAADVLFNRVLAASPGAVEVVGIAVGLYKGSWLPAGVGVVTVEGKSAALNYTQVGQFVLVAGAGQITVAGLPATLLANRVLVGEHGSVSVTGLASILARGFSLIGGTGAITVEGKAAGTYKGSVLTAEPASVLVAGLPCGLLKFSHLVADAGTVIVQGLPAGTLYGRTLSAAPGSIALHGNDVTILYDRVLQALAGAITVRGIDIDLLYKGATTLGLLVHLIGSDGRLVHVVGGDGRLVSVEGDDGGMVELLGEHGIVDLEGGGNNG